MRAAILIEEILYFQADVRLREEMMAVLNAETTALTDHHKVEEKETVTVSTVLAREVDMNNARADLTVKAETEKVDFVVRVDSTVKVEIAKADSVARVDLTVKAETEKVDFVARVDSTVRVETAKADSVAKVDLTAKVETVKVDSTDPVKH